MPLPVAQSKRDLFGEERLIENQVRPKPDSPSVRAKLGFHPAGSMPDSSEPFQAAKNFMATKNPKARRLARHSRRLPAFALRATARLFSGDGGRAENPAPIRQNSFVVLRRFQWVKPLL